MCVCVGVKSGTGSQQEKTEESIHNLGTNSHTITIMSLFVLIMLSSSTSFYASLFLFTTSASLVSLVVCPVAGSPEGSTQGNV